VSYLRRGPQCSLWDTETSEGGRMRGADQVEAISLPKVQTSVARIQFAEHAGTAIHVNDQAY
jgi:hypothetical protein